MFFLSRAENDLPCDLVHICVMCWAAEKWIETNSTVLRKIRHGSAAFREGQMIADLMRNDKKNKNKKTERLAIVNRKKVLKGWFIQKLK